MAFQKGQSGNPNGRPKKDRALAKILERAGSTSIERNPGEKKISRKKLLAEMVWEAATTGKVQLPNFAGVIEVKDMAEWITLIKFIHVHVDGPAKTEVDLTSANQPLTFNILPALPALAEASAEEAESD